MAKFDARIGFVGVGRMGANMARHLHDERCNVVAVHDADAARAHELAAELSCQAAATPAEVARSAEFVVTVVPDDAAMRAIFDPAAPASLAQAAQGRLFINCGTLSPGVHVDVQGIVEAKGGRTLEACMASSIPQARDGSLYLMCGGREADFERARPLLDLLSANLRYVGPAGSAAKVKALVNMVMNANTAALAEGLGLGEALGLDLDMLREVFSQTGAASRVLVTDGEDMQNREHECYFSAAHAAKDSGIALSLAGAAGLRLPVAEAALGQFRRLVDLGKGGLDKSAVAELTFRGRS